MGNRFHIRDQRTGLVILRNLTRAQVDAYFDAHPFDDLAAVPAAR